MAPPHGAAHHVPRYHQHAAINCNRRPMNTEFVERPLHLQEEITMDQAIDLVGMGRFQYGIMVAAGLCFAADAMEILLLSFLSLVLQREWNLTNHQTSFITASVFAGSFLGTLGLGRLGDVWGRKPVFLLTAFMVSVFGVGTAAVQTYLQLVLCRFMVGVGVGGIGVVFDTLAEFMPTDRRGERLVYTSYFWTFATMMVPVFAYFTLGGGQYYQNNKDKDNNWRLFVICCVVPCMIATLVTIYTVPESPRFLAESKNDPNRALTILRTAASTNGKDPYQLFPQGTRLVAANEAETTTFCDLLSPELRPTTLLLWAVWGTYALLYHGTIIAVTLLFYTNNNNNESQSDFDYPAMIIAASAEMVGVTMVLLTVDRFGRIACQMAFFSIGGMVLLAPCVWKSNHQHTDNHYQRTLLVVLAFLARMFVYSGSGVVWITTAELVPAEIRAAFHSVANAVARIGAFTSPYLVSTFTPIINIGMIMLAVSIINVVCTWHLPETVGRPMGSLRIMQSTAERRDEFEPVPLSEDTMAA